MPFTEIKKYPLFYISDMLQNPSDSFLMYQYGPYMLMNTNYSKILTRNKTSILYYKNPIVAFMVDVSDMVKAVHLNIPIKDIKEIILNVITSLPNPTNDFFERCAIKTKDIGFRIIKDIQEIQYENNSLESAMLNYSPIVPYSGTIKKENIKAPELVELKYETLDTLIKDYLIENITEIMLHNEDFISVDKHDSEYMLRENETIASDLSYDIIKSYNDQENVNPSVKTYFSLVYLRYAIPKEKIQDAIQTLIKINTTYNKLIKGEEVNVMEAVETFSKLSLPPNSSLC